MVVEQNTRGRILIDTFEVKRLAYNYINENYSQFDCVELKVKNPNLKIKLRAKNDYKLDVLQQMRSEIISMYKERVNFDVKQLDLEIL